MSTMLYKVAAAIAAVDLVREAPDDPTFDFCALTEEVADVYYDIARAAIEAMMEPTEAMLDAPYHAEIDFGPGGSGDIQASPDNVWAAMVKAALKEQA